jgi:toxin-antitoxin system PIN domain toxin
MTSFFPDVNVWLALSVDTHAHSSVAWKWMRTLPADAQLLFSRYTQLGLLRLLTHSAVMGDETLNLRRAWAVFDRWLEDPRVELYPDPRNIDNEFRKATAPFASKPASKWVGDCWIVASAVGNIATLVTFDKALHDFARKQGHPAVIPG